MPDESFVVEHLLGQRSTHQQKVDAFMVLAKQHVPALYPEEPTLEVRKLRARLILEEAIETIEAGLGLRVIAQSLMLEPPGKTSATVDQFKFEAYDFEEQSAFNMVELVDGCCDIAVVTTGTLSACGVPDEAFQLEVDNNNLAKFGPGCSWREDGKLIKPPDHKPPRIKELLDKLRPSA